MRLAYAYISAAAAFRPLVRPYARRRTSAAAAASDDGDWFAPRHRAACPLVDDGAWPRLEAAARALYDWNAKINYTCNAGGHNAFVSNRWKDFYELTCQEDNNFSTPTWPTCVSSRVKKNWGLGLKMNLFQQSTVRVHLTMKRRKSNALR